MLDLEGGPATGLPSLDLKSAPPKVAHTAPGLDLDAAKLPPLPGAGGAPRPSRPKAKRPSDPRRKRAKGNPKQGGATAADGGVGFDPLDDAFSNLGGGGPALELDAATPKKRKRRSTGGARASGDGGDTPAPDPDRALDKLAAYPAPPQGAVQAAPYFARVLLRRRAIDEEIARLDFARRRAETQADEALTALGEALFAKRDDPDMARLAESCAEIANVQDTMGSLDANAASQKQTSQGAMSAADTEAARIEAELAPLRRRETKLQAQLEALTSKAKRAEAARKRTEQQLKQLNARDPQNKDRIKALQAELGAHFQDHRMLTEHVEPLEGELGRMRREVARRLGTLAALREEQRNANAALRRIEDSHRSASGSARTALQQAMANLGGEALDLDLAALAGETATAAEQARQRAQDRQAEQDRHRLARDRYDHDAFARGRGVVFGALALLVVLVVVAAL
jgi:hypothetical protein